MKSRIINAKERKKQQHNKKNPPELIINPEEDLLTDCITCFVYQHLVESREVFLSLLSEGLVKINDEVLEADELDRVLICGDLLKLGKKQAVKIIK